MRELQRREGPSIPLPEYNIRHRSSWEEVEDCLVRAWARYDGDLGRRRGKFKDQCRRAVADYGHVGKQALRFGKDLEYMSVVLGIVEILVDVSTLVWKAGCNQAIDINHSRLSQAAVVASRVREYARSALELRELKYQFGQIELLMMLHPHDTNIQEAATGLVVHILEAIEEGIAFFVKPKRKFPPACPQRPIQSNPFTSPFGAPEPGVFIVRLPPSQMNDAADIPIHRSACRGSHSTG